MKTIVCGHCGKTVKQVTKWQAFCSDTCRWAHWSAKHPRSEAEPSGDSYPPCYYCGQPGTTVDHVPPQSIRVRLAELKLLHEWAFHEVRCCRECNCLLGSRPIFHLTERKRFIKLTLRKRYARFLRIPDWTDEDLARLGHTLKSNVLAGILTAQIIRQRLQW